MEAGIGNSVYVILLNIVMDLPFFGKKENYSLGVDLGTHSVKTVELVHKGDGHPSLNNYAQFYTSSSYITRQGSSFKLIETDMGEVLAEMIERAQFKAKEAIISLPVFSSFSTFIELPNMPEGELTQEVVRMEARKYIPVPMDEVEFSWIRIDHLSGEDTIKVLVIAVPSEVIRKYTSIVKEAQLELAGMELDTFSAARSLVSSEPEAVMVLDIGARTTNAGIVDAGMVVMHYNIDMGGTNFTKALVRGMNIDKSRAEELKKTKGLRDPDGQVGELLKSTASKISNEAERIIEDYIKEGGKRISRIVITGGSAQMLGLDNYLAQDLNVPVEVGDPFQFVDTPKELDPVLKNGGREFTVATGLALRPAVQ